MIYLKVHLIIHVLSIINGLNTSTWFYLDSSIETTSSSKIYISEKVYETLSMKTYTLNGDYYLEVQRGSAIKAVLIYFPAIDSFVVYDNTYYICPSGINQPYVYKYKDSATKISTLPYGISEYSSWRVRCYYS